MKLEDIKLQLGDKITFDDGEIVFISDCHIDGLTHINLLRVVKIERYYPISDYNEYVLSTIYERKEILDKEEKEYLSNVIRPFRDNVRYIQKSCIYHKQSEFIFIKMKDDKVINFPLFKMKTMYKGMEEGKKYSLEELGL